MTLGAGRHWSDTSRYLFLLLDEDRKRLFQQIPALRQQRLFTNLYMELVKKKTTLLQNNFR